MHVWPLPVRMLRYMEQYGSLAFTSDDLAKAFDCSPGRAHGAVKKLINAGLIRQTRTITGTSAYILETNGNHVTTSNDVRNHSVTSYPQQRKQR